MEWWPTSGLTPDSRNTRRHSDEQLDLINASMERYGTTFPVLVRQTGDREGVIIAGEGRWRTNVKFGRDETKVLVAEGWSDAQIQAYIIDDNQLPMLAEWDQEMLQDQLRQLMAGGMSPIGFTQAQIDNILRSPDGATDPDEAPALPLVATSQIGDVWVLGGHRIICGDSTRRETVERLLGAVRPHLMVSDPPYGVEYDAAWRGKAKRSDGKRASLGVHAKGKVENDDRADWREAWALFEGDVAYIWHAGVWASVTADSLIACGFQLRSQIVWRKTNFAIGRGDYHWSHEPCWYVVRKGRKGHWAGDRKQQTVWEIAKPAKSETGHSTQKPIECMQRPIENNSRPGDAVYEPFCGSGTTIIACERTGRACYAIELNPAYVDVAVRRWQDFTRGEAILEATGQTFAALAAERADQTVV